MAAEVVTLRDGSEAACQPFPPDGQDEQFETGSTPVKNDGGFLDNHANRGCNCTRPNKPHAPVDEETGLPLAIVPYLEMDSMDPSLKNPHHAIYPRRHPLLQSIGGKALRVARLQIVPEFYHNGNSPTAFHAIYGDGVGISTNEDELAGQVALLVAGFIAEDGVDTSTGEATTRRFTDEERKYLTRTVAVTDISDTSIEKFRKLFMPHSTHPDAKDKLDSINANSALQRYQSIYFGGDQVTQFLRRYVIERDTSMLNRKLMNKFLNRGTPEHGMTLLGQAAAIAAETAIVAGVPLRYSYANMRSRGLINPNMPIYASDFLLTRLGSKVGRLGLLELFRHELARTEQIAS